jgi:hypothetical protein
MPAKPLPTDRSVKITKTELDEHRVSCTAVIDGVAVTVTFDPLFKGPACIVMTPESEMENPAKPSATKGSQKHG